MLFLRKFCLHFVGVVVVVVVALPLTVASDQIGSFVNMYLLNATSYIQMPNIYAPLCTETYYVLYLAPAQPWENHNFKRKIPGQYRYLDISALAIIYIFIEIATRQM